MNIINTRQDIEKLPEPEKSAWLARLAASIHRYDAEGEIVTDESTITRFGYSLEDFPDAPIADYVAPAPPPPPAAIELAKLDIRRKLRLIGKEDALDAMLDTIPHARKDWDDSKFILTTDPMFVQHRPTVQAMLGLTDEQWNGLLGIPTPAPAESENTP